MATVQIPHAMVTEAMFNIPAVLLGAYLIYLRTAYGRAARLPFTEMPLRQPGASSRARADDAFESGMTAALLIIITCGYFGILCSFNPPPADPHFERNLFILVAIVVVAVGAWIGRRLKRSWRYRLGADGEQVVGRELDKLIADGYQVFHDVPLGRGNVDHVVVGPAGVFAVETKTYRKRKLRKNERSEVVLNDDRLLWLGCRPDTKPIQQVKRAAVALGYWIERESGERVRVAPAIALPGWYLRIERYGDVAVYSASGMSAHLIKRGRESLTPLQIDRISRPLAKLCSSPL